MAALNVEIPDGLKKALARSCIDRDVTLKSAIAEAIAKWVTAGHDKMGIPIVNAGKQTVPIGEKSLSGGQGQTLESGEDAEGIPKLTELEDLCIGRLLCILRSPKPGLPDAIISNLAQFAEFAVLYDRATNPDQASKFTAGEPRGIGGRDAAIYDLKRDTRRSGDASLRASAELGKAEGSRGREHQREAGNTKPPRKRSGA